MAYGTSYDQPDEYVRLGAATVMLATHKFVEFMVEPCQATYLRPPSNNELKALLRRNAAHGVPGCIGSIDCTHWTWSACPKGLAGQYQGRGGKRTVVIKTVCNADAYIWLFYIGSLGNAASSEPSSKARLFSPVLSLLKARVSVSRNRIPVPKIDRPPLTGSQRPSHARSLHICVCENRNRSLLRTLRLLEEP